MGVRMCDWNDVREDIGSSMQGKSFKNIVYRSVEFNREDNLRYLYTFFRNYLGNDYSLTF